MLRSGIGADDVERNIVSAFNLDGSFSFYHSTQTMLKVINESSGNLHVLLLGTLNGGMLEKFNLFTVNSSVATGQHVRKFRPFGAAREERAFKTQCWKLVETCPEFGCLNSMDAWKQLRREDREKIYGAFCCHKDIEDCKDIEAVQYLRWIIEEHSKFAKFAEFSGNASFLDWLCPPPPPPGMSPGHSGFPVTGASVVLGSEMTAVTGSAVGLMPSPLGRSEAVPGVREATSSVDISQSSSTGADQRAPVETSLNSLTDLFSTEQQCNFGGRGFGGATTGKHPSTGLLPNFLKRCKQNEQSGIVDWPLIQVGSHTKTSVGGYR